MYHQFIPVHSHDYLNNISIKIYVATEEGISRNEIHLAVDQNGRVFDALNFKCNIIKVIFI